VDVIRKIENLYGPCGRVVPGVMKYIFLLVTILSVTVRNVYADSPRTPFPYVVMEEAVCESAKAFAANPNRRCLLWACSNGD
jgi:hypothetical protein